MFWEDMWQQKDDNAEKSGRKQARKLKVKSKNLNNTKIDR